MTVNDSEERPRALINVNVSDMLGLSKAGEELAKAITRGTGLTVKALAAAASRLAYPYLRKRDADADAASLTTYAGALNMMGLEVTSANLEVPGRTIARLSAEAISHQENRENIALMSVREHVDSASAEQQGATGGEMSIDWVDAFWRYAETTSDEAMQSAWRHG